MKTNLIIGAVTLGAIATTAATAYAFNPDVKDALDNNDYNSWVDAISDTPRGDEMLSVINESNFDQLVEANQLRESGDMEGAKTIMEELGLDQFMGKGPGGDRGGDPEQMQAVRDAIAAGDYDAWVAAMGDGERAQEILSVINQDNFDQFVQAHQLMDQGRQILEDLGVPQPMKGGNGPEHRGQGMNGQFNNPDQSNNNQSS